MYNKILLPVSVNQVDIARTALEKAKQLCAEGGEIIALNAQEPIPGPAAHYLPKEALPDRDSDIRHTLSELVGTDDNVRIELVSGRAGVAIVEYARKQSADCIIIASHRPELKDYLLGSTASRVVRHSPCSVLVIR